MKWILVVTLWANGWTGPKEQYQVPGWSSEYTCNQAAREVQDKYIAKATCEIDITTQPAWVAPVPR